MEESKVEVTVERKEEATVEQLIHALRKELLETAAYLAQQAREEGEPLKACAMADVAARTFGAVCR